MLVPLDAESLIMSCCHVNVPPPVHWCRQWVSAVLLVVSVTLLLLMLMTASERFFCPSLELIAAYLKLPPAVAGATLLSFGNGAPDLFTQLAAVSQVGYVIGAAACSSH